MLINVNELENRLKKDISSKKQITIKISCFKKDRNISIEVFENHYYIKETGIIHKEFNVSNSKELLKLLNNLANKEFFNSHKLWYQTKKKD